MYSYIYMPTYATKNNDNNYKVSHIANPYTAVACKSYAYMYIYIYIYTHIYIYIYIYIYMHNSR